MTEGNDHRDPALIATATPEETSPTDPVFAVGVGPGNLDFLTPRADQALTGADVVVGFETVIELVRDRIDGTVLPCGYETEASQIERFAEQTRGGASGTAVLMGDPNHSGYQFLGKIEAAVDQPVRVVPGISSVQIAASRARTPMEDTTFVTLHQRGPLTDALERLATDVGQRHLLVLPRPGDWMPEAIAEWLLKEGASPSATALVMERLTMPDERIHRTTLAALSGQPAQSAFTPLSVLAVRRTSETR
ncbi:cobalt-precorrin-7 (C(5))-methyltransferase [Halocatena halophila]|uniref:cobalt-precorrin-7 (C(5))-methyltransferase n=1 Tax=Halocatena halophila TaxID=2814576 RepID=UPI002ED2CC98